MLTLAEMLASRDLTVGLECVAFSAEEYGPLGDPTYISHSGDEMGDILVAVNLDGIGQRVGTNTITMMAHSQAFAAEAEIWAARYPGMIWVDPWPQSNHSTFARQGVPSIAFTSHFAGVTDINHLPTDTIEWISADKLHEVTALVSEIVEGLQDKSLEWCRGAAQAGEPGQE
jgi:Zn-dependent M28 family amino/carboxypeptidase